MSDKGTLSVTITVMGIYKILQRTDKRHPITRKGIASELQRLFEITVSRHTLAGHLTAIEIMEPRLRVREPYHRKDGYLYWLSEGDDDEDAMCETMPEEKPDLPC